MSFSSPFPIELSDFEYLMYRDDSPQYPMTFCLQTTVSGGLKRDEFEQALKSALDRHPLFQAIVRRHWNHYFWIAHPIEKLPLDWDLSEAASSPQPSPVNLSQTPGIRVWARQCERGVLVVWQFHHACSDGIGSLQFIGDVFAHYGILTVEEGQTAPKLQTLDPDLLKQRGKLISAGKGQVPSNHSLKTLIRRFRRLVGRRTMPLAASPRKVETEDRPLMFTHLIDPPTLKLLNRFASNSDVNLNSLLLREMFLTLREWNEKHNGLPQNQWLRLGMPLNMRTSKHVGIPACNMVSMMFFPRTAEDCQNEEQLLQGIQKQTIKTLHNRLGNLLLAGIRRIRKVPGLLPLLLSSKRPFTTAVLANIGEVRKHFGAEFPHRKGCCIAGNVVIEQVDGVAPIRPGTRMAVSVGIYGRQLIINMNCDQKFLSRQQSEELLDSFVNRLESLSKLVPRKKDLPSESSLSDVPPEKGSNST
ncbi:MAG: hypothetical protein HUJ26_00220 [Planctomycetaceae bacterium]|nr:hypothetical protein [Planctomycetaceae bacterium]